MNQAGFRFYAELNDFLSPEKRFTVCPFGFCAGTPVKDAVESFGVPHTEVDLVLVNGLPVDFTYALCDGDRVSVYPVFEALDISSLTRLRPAPLRTPRFVLDVHLGTLAAYLRMLGFDTLYRNDLDDDELARVSAAGHRILLTRDRELLKRSLVTHGYAVRSTGSRKQIAEVLERFDLFASIQPFTRCMRCNTLLEPTSKQAVAGRLPDRSRVLYNEFQACSGCGRVYWKGSHHRRMTQFIESLQKRS